MDRNEIKEILESHEKWVNGGDGGKRADLRGANLIYADLRGANLMSADLMSADLIGADLSGVNMRRADLRYADLSGADLGDANLRGADLRGANLSGTDLRGADIDFAAWPLWCGSLKARVCVRIAQQLAYHFCSLGCDDPEYTKARNAILPFANKFHRVEECGLLKFDGGEADDKDTDGGTGDACPGVGQGRPEPRGDA